MYHKLLFLLTTCVLPILADTSDCADIPGCSSCRTMLEGQFEYQCPHSANNPTFTFQYLPRQVVYLECSDEAADLRDFPASQLRELNKIPAFVVKGCHIPSNFSLANLSKKLGMKNVTTVHLQEIRFDDTLKAANFQGFTEVLKLTLMKLNLPYVDEDLLSGTPKLQILNLKDNHVNISQAFLRKVPDLTNIELSMNQITEIQPRTFAYLPNLKLLNMWQNNLTTIGKYALYNLESLESLDLSRNPLEEISPEAFSTLVSLKRLHLNGVQLESLPRNLFRNNTKLTNFRAYGNKVNVTDMPDEMFSNFQHLETVVISNFGLIYLPKNTFSGSSNIKEIDLSQNYLNDLPEDLFQGLTKLTKLSLGYNQIQVIPGELLSDFQKLEDLDLTKNQIKIIDK